jgi:hypothetical protein
MSFALTTANFSTCGGRKDFDQVLDIERCNPRRKIAQPLPDKPNSQSSGSGLVSALQLSKSFK